MKELPAIETAAPPLNYVIITPKCKHSKEPMEEQHATYNRRESPHALQIEENTKWKEATMKNGLGQ